MPKDLMEIRLKETCRLTDSEWAAWVESGPEGWKLRSAYKLNQKQRYTLLKYLQRSDVNSWLGGAISGRHARSRAKPDELPITGKRIFAFPDLLTQRVVLIGAINLSDKARRLWRVVSMENSGRAVLRGPNQPHKKVEIGLNFPYYLPEALSQLSEPIFRTVDCQGGWLAIRSGDTLEIKVGSNCKNVLKKKISIEANPLLREISQTLRPCLVEKSQLEWAMVPQFDLKANTKIWGALPLTMGRRFIGLVALWNNASISKEDWKQLDQLCAQLSPSIEANITFSDITNHLQRMALLNDFALTVSSAYDLEHIAQRVFALLQRAFETERIILYVLSPDSRTLYNFYERENKIVLQTQPASSDSPIHWPGENSEIYRVESITSNSLYEPKYTGSRAALLVPLKYRRQLIGAIGLENVEEGAFSVYDEHLLVVIASHLAGLIENGRLRQETELRARNLSLVHEVVEHIIGLTDIHQVAQITAELLAKNLAYELAAVLLFDKPEGQLKVFGIGGSAADVVQQWLQYMDVPSGGGITSRVSVTGQSMLVSDVTKDPVYRPIPNWDAGSELCVPLREGNHILGVINIESQQKNAFTQNDLLLLEALAGIFSNVISNVVQYQKLEATVNQLQAAREELQERIAAQRVTESRLIQAAKLVAVGEMAAGVAHELNNPLTTVSGFVELVLNDLPDNSTSHDDLELVLREANRAKGVVRRLLDFARQSESTRVSSDINEIVSDVLALVNHLLQTNGIQISSDLGDHLPWVSIDRNQIKQVLLNLIHNAIHAMPRGGKLTILTGRNKHERKDCIMIRVRDTGTGITPEHLGRIFEPFFTTRSNEGGTGLGLSVSYGIIADHSGSIDVDSQVGKGSTFTVWLPIKTENRPA